MVMLGAVLACDPTVSKESVWAALPQVATSRPELIVLNKRAITAGIEAATQDAAGKSGIRSFSRMPKFSSSPTT